MSIWDGDSYVCPQCGDRFVHNIFVYIADTYCCSRECQTRRVRHLDAERERAALS